MEKYKRNDCERERDQNTEEKSYSGNYFGSTHRPTNLARRNARERKRVQTVNMGFAILRQHVPQLSSNKKLSKVETLRSAIRYIKQLQRLLDDHTPQVYCQQYPGYHHTSYALSRKKSPRKSPVFNDVVLQTYANKTP